MHRKMIESSKIWNLPFDFTGHTGVLYARANADTVAVYVQGQWHGYDLATYNTVYKTPFPEMCPHEGWCVLTGPLEMQNGIQIEYPVTPDVLAYAIEDQAHEHLFGFTPDRVRSYEARESRAMQAIRNEFTKATEHGPAEPRKQVILKHERTPKVKPRKLERVR